MLDTWGGIAGKVRENGICRFRLAMEFRFAMWGYGLAFCSAGYSSAFCIVGYMLAFGSVGYGLAFYGVGLRFGQWMRRAANSIVFIILV